MSNVDDATLLVDNGPRPWTPKHETFTQPVQRLLDVWNPPSGTPLARYNATTGLIQRLLGDARRARARVRAMGGGWSFSTAAATEGWLVNTRPLNLSFGVLPTMVDPRYPGSAGGLRFAQCGCSVQELNRRFRADRRSLRTTGASNGQTIAGAIATGTHGSAFDVGAVHDGVVGLHLAAGPDRSLWLERASQPVMSDGFAARLGAVPVRDDALFDAALVSFGSFGMVLGVMLETDEAFLLQSFRRRAPFDAGLRRAISTLDFSGVALPGGARRPYHIQVVVNPFDLDRGVFLTTMYRLPFRDDYTPPGDVFGAAGPGDDALAFVGLLSDAVPALIPTLATQLLGRAYGDINGAVGTIGEIFSNTSTRGKAASTAMGIPLARAGEALDVVLELNRRHGPYAVLPALRYVRSTRATLGFTRHGAVTCVLELDGPLSARTADLYRRVWQAFADRQLPFTFHWGKILDTSTPAWVRRAYGPAADRWIAARERLLDADARRMFSYRYLESLGLST